MRRIGILGGTFNPVHNGHLNLAKQLSPILKLDRVIFVPAYIPPHKRVAGNVSSKERLRLVRLAIKKNRRLGVSTFEIDKKGKSYSVDTLKYFKKRYGQNVKLFFITGADSLAGLGKWKNLKNIFKLACFIVATRPGYKFKSKFPEIKFIPIRPVDISSTEIRALIKKGKRIDSKVPRDVARDIEKKGLYK